MFSSKIINKPIFVFPSVIKVLFSESASFPWYCFSSALYSLNFPLSYEQVWPPGSEYTSQMVNLGKQTYFQFVTSFSVCTRSAFLLGRTEARKGREKHTHPQMISCCDWQKLAWCLINTLPAQLETLAGSGVEMTGKKEMFIVSFLWSETLNINATLQNL